MTAVSGARLGPYEILAPLGTGGMGEVYRANDTRLGREVAIKLLPEAFASDPDRVAPVVHALYRAFFVDDLDISSPEIAASVAATCAAAV